MRAIGKVLVLLVVAAALLPAGGEARRRRVKKSETKSFDGVERVEIAVVSGGCVVTKADGDRVTVRLESRWDEDDDVEMEIDRDGDVLEIREEGYGSYDGSCDIHIEVPDGIEIEFNSASGGMSIEGVDGEFSASTASGDFRLEDCAGRFRLSTASGDYRVSDCAGRFRLSTASGDIDARDCRGEFNCSTASGDVEARKIVLDGDSEFSSASGDASVVLGESASHDLSVSSASGDARLDLAGNDLTGYVEMTAKKRRGSIRCPFDFDDEETFRHRGSRDRYVRKSFTRGSEEPVITISTASGKAELKK